MEITCLTVGDLATNCYLVTDEDTGETLIIDPGDEGDFISTTLLEKKLIPQAIILTHGHYDHCLAVLELKLNFNIPIYLHQADLFLYQNAHQSSVFWNSSLRRGTDLPAGRQARQFTSLKPPPIDFYISDQQIIPFSQSSLQVLHTPGHTPGSCCFLGSNNHEPITNNVLFTGDTLFAEDVGRTDLSYSSLGDLQKSLKKLRQLPPETLIYPGHEDYGFTLNSNQK